MRCQRRFDSTDKTGTWSDGERNYKSIPHCIKVGQIKFLISLRLKCLGVNRFLQL